MDLGGSLPRYGKRSPSILVIEGKRIPKDFVESRASSLRTDDRDINDNRMCLKSSGISGSV